MKLNMYAACSETVVWCACVLIHIQINDRQGGRQLLQRSGKTETCAQNACLLQSSVPEECKNHPLPHALRGNRTPGGSMATTQITTTPLMLHIGCINVLYDVQRHNTTAFVGNMCIWHTQLFLLSSNEFCIVLLCFLYILRLSTLALLSRLPFCLALLPPSLIVVLCNLADFPPYALCLAHQIHPPIDVEAARLVQSFTARRDGVVQDR